MVGQTMQQVEQEAARRGEIVVWEKKDGSYTTTISKPTTGQIQSKIIGSAANAPSIIQPKFTPTQSTVAVNPIITSINGEVKVYTETSLQKQVREEWESAPQSTKIISEVVRVASPTMALATAISPENPQAGIRIKPEERIIAGASIGLMGIGATGMVLPKVAITGSSLLGGLGLATSLPEAVKGDPTAIAGAGLSAIGLAGTAVYAYQTFSKPVVKEAFIEDVRKIGDNTYASREIIRGKWGIQKFEVGAKSLIKAFPGDDYTRSVGISELTTSTGKKGYGGMLGISKQITPELQASLVASSTKWGETGPQIIGGKYLSKDIFSTPEYQYKAVIGEFKGVKTYGIAEGLVRTEATKIPEPIIGAAAAHAAQLPAFIEAMPSLVTTPLPVYAPAISIVPKTSHQLSSVSIKSSPMEKYVSSSISIPMQKEKSIVSSSVVHVPSSRESWTTASLFSTSTVERQTQSVVSSSLIGTSSIAPTMITPKIPSFGLPRFDGGGFTGGDIIPSTMRKQTTRYKPSLYGLWSGKTISKIPGKLTGMEVRYPIGRTMRKKKKGITLKIVLPKKLKY